MKWAILEGDCRARLADLPAESVHVCVTSPPYWSLRDYGVAGQLGLEPTPEEYVTRMVEVFREVRRVLRDDGTLWLNLGDTYAGSGRGIGDTKTTNKGNAATRGVGPRDMHDARVEAGAIGRDWVKPPPRLKSKDLVGIPWAVAFALRTDGWYLRSDIIWAKPNCMPESVTDRPTKAHEYLFLLAKGQRKSRVIQFSDLAGQYFHLGKYVGPNLPDMGPLDVCVALSRTIFDSAQREQEFGLPPFYAQEWKKSADGSDSDFVRCLPRQHGPTIWAARFLQAEASAEEFLRELHRLRFALRDGDKFLVGGVPAESLDSPAVDGDGKGTVAVHHSGKISEVDFVHGRIVVSSPATCNYYYDAESIKEPCVYGDHARNGVPGTVVQMPGQSPQNGITKLRSSGNKTRAYGGAAGQRPADHLGSGVPWTDKDGKRNRRDVWTITTQPFPGSHFATFPEKLVEPCVLAGAPVGGVVLDPFAGAGTAGVVALKHTRNFIGCERNPEYVAMARQRIRDEAGVFTKEEPEFFLKKDCTVTGA